MNGFLTLQSTLVIIGSVAINFSLAVFWMRWEKLRFFITKYEKHTPLLVMLIFLATWAFIFLIYKFPISGDVVSFFLPQGNEAFRGAIPNRDFVSSYMPLFPYITGLVYLVYPDNRTLSLFFALCVSGFAFLFYKVIYKTENSSVLFVVGLVSSVILLLGIGYQQDELYILFLSGFLFLALKKKKDLLAGSLTGLILVLTKATIIVFLFPFFLMSERKKDFLIGACLSTIPVLGLFILLGFSPTMMLTGERAAIVPPSLVTDFRLIPPIYLFLTSNPLVTYLLNALVLGFIAIFVLRRQLGSSFGNLLSLIVVLWFLFLIMSMKSLTSYRLLVIPFIPFVLEIYRRRYKYLPIYFAFYCSLVSVHYMFYEDWNKITRLHPYLSTVPKAQITQYIILTVIELLIIVFEIGWVSLAMKTITNIVNEQSVPDRILIGNL